MIPLCQTPRSLAVQSIPRLPFGALVLALSLVGAAGCSNSDDSALEYDAGSQSTGTGATTDSNGGESGETGETGETSDTNDGGTMPAPEPKDPDLVVGLCDAQLAQSFSYSLVQANAEAEPVLVRESVLAGDGTVPAIPLSARPFLNRFDFAYPPAYAWDPEVSGELWQPPMINGDGPARYHLQYAIRGPEMSADERLPVDLAIVVDLGATMLGALDLAEEALAAIESSLAPGDRVSLIAAGGEPIDLGTVIVDNFGLTPLTGLLAQQELMGSADVAAAVELAYAKLDDNWDGQAQAQTRVLLISNGYFDAGTLISSVESHAAEGELLVSLGVGAVAQYDALLLGALATEGRGAMLFASNEAEVWTALQEQFTAHMIAAATDLEVTLTLPAGLGVRQHEPVNGEMLDPKLAVLGPNHALVFHHELEACGDLDPGAEIGVEVDWVDPLTGEGKQLVWTKPVSEIGEGSLYGHKGAATVAYARALRAFRDGDATGSYGAVLDALAQISDALVNLPEDADLLEMSAVLAELSVD